MENIKITDNYFPLNSDKKKEEEKKEISESSNDERKKKEFSFLPETNKTEIPKEVNESKEQLNKYTQKIIHKTKINKEMKLEQFFEKNRHYFIMTDGGKPVYSRYGDEVENSTIFATISAIITKFTIFNSTDEKKEEINIISNSKNVIVFLKKGALIFIVLSKKNDSISLLQSQLEYLFQQ